MMFSRDIGSMNFQANAISWSERRRGNVPRIQIMRKIRLIALIPNQSHEGTASRNQSKKRNNPAIHDNQDGRRFASHSRPGACQPPRKSVTARPDSPMAARYSARKKMANLNPLYSV